MLVIPFTLPPEAKRGPLVLVAILEKENLDRMRLGDPFDMHLSAYDKPYWDVARPVRELDIVIAYEEDINTLMAFKQSNNLKGLLAWLERGRVHKVGDLLPPIPLRKQ